jgi:hypothetical protein
MARMRCPMGLAEVKGKLPIEIAVSIAGEIIATYNACFGQHDAAANAGPIAQLLPPPAAAKPFDECVMTVTRKAYRAAILHSIADPAEVGLASHEYFEDGLLVVDDGRISALGHASELLPTLDADIEVSTTRMR